MNGKIPTIVWSNQNTGTSSSKTPLDTPFFSSQSSRVTRTSDYTSSDYSGDPMETPSIPQFNFSPEEDEILNDDISTENELEDNAMEPEVQIDENEAEKKEDKTPLFDLSVVNSVYTIGPNQIRANKSESPNSLYSILSRYTLTPMGRSQIRFQLLHPLRRIQDIEGRLSSVEVFYSNSNAMDLIKPHLRRMISINKIQRRLATPGNTAMSDWYKILKVLENIDDLRETLQCESSLNFCRDLLESYYHNEITLLRKELERAFNYEESIIHDKFVVKAGYDQEIDNYRSQIQDLEEYLQVATQSVQKLWKSLKLDPFVQYHIAYLEDVGFLLLIPTDVNSLEHIVTELDQVMERKINTEMFLFYKNEYFDELDRHYHFPRELIDTKSWAIHERIREQFLNISLNLAQIIECIAGIEAMVTFATAALDLDWKRPTITETQFEIVNGRHPIFDVTTSNFVPNDFSGEKRVKVITGPNASGKSVYITQTALIVHLAMCGCFVPAEIAIIPIVDRILCINKPIHTITNETSLFTSDLKKMVSSIEKLTSKSLFLIDEFGKSTRSEDGTALLFSVIQKCLNMTPPPITLIVTHFHALCQLLPSTNPNLHFLEFQTRPVENDFVYTYSFCEGSAKRSFTQAVYKLVQMDKEVAKRAEEVEETLNNRTVIFAKYDAEQENQLKKVKLVIEKFLRVQSTSYIGILKFFSEVKEIMQIDTQDDSSSVGAGTST